MQREFFLWIGDECMKICVNLTSSQLIAILTNKDLLKKMLHTYQALNRLLKQEYLCLLRLNSIAFIFACIIALINTLM